MDLLIPPKIDDLSREIIEYFKSHSKELHIKDSKIYYNYPLFRDDENQLVDFEILFFSKPTGVVLIISSDKTNVENVDSFLDEIDRLDQIYYILLSRLQVNRTLRKIFPKIPQLITKIIYNPFLTEKIEDDDTDIKIINKLNDFKQFFKEREQSLIPISDIAFLEICASIDGSKSINIQKKRIITNISKNSKGWILNKLESEIAIFDRKQKALYIKDLKGPQRIRGLAGSGKTIIIAMKAALIHLKEPEKTILFTFWTKSLYQYIKNLIGTFYRQYNNYKEPDWNKICVLHAWGGKYDEGVYYNTCSDLGIPATPFSRAKRLSSNPFDFLCNELLNYDIKPKYDYTLIDEGQDFPPSYIQLCAKLTRDYKFIVAYDEFQNIFQTKTLSPEEIFGINKEGKPNFEFEEDFILYKCYRNPREIIVCAHALGLGIYGDKIVQMLENKDYWEDIGYKIIEGELRQGEKIIIQRPEENSLRIISDNFSKDEIIRFKTFNEISEEVKFIVKSITYDINEENLRPDDILVIVVDDYGAKNYLESIQEELHDENINSNNIHDDDYSIKDFKIKGCVTLSTVHKAKGNESYSVYVAGVDALFYSIPMAKERNMLFTAITRSKGWVTITGIGKNALKCKKEYDEALKNFPNLIFTYPEEKELKIMRRDLKALSIKKMRIQKKVEELMKDLGENYSNDEVLRIIKEELKKKEKKIQ